MKILFFQPLFTRVGGIETWSDLLSDAFVNQQNIPMEVHVLTCYEPDRAPSNKFVKIASFKEGVSHGNISKLLKMFVRAWKLARYVSRYKIDVVIVSADGVGISAAISKWFFNRAKIILVVHEQIKTLNPISRKWYPKALRAADARVAVSTGIVSTLTDIGEVKVLPNFIDINRAKQLVEMPLTLSASDEEFLKSKKPYLMIGRLVPIKNHLSVLHGLLDAPDAHLAIIGTGAMEEAIHMSIAHFGLQGRVKLFGEQRNVYNILAQSRGLIVASEFESFGIVIIEALAAGVPVVSTDCDFGPREILDMPGTGLYPQTSHYGVLIPMVTDERFKSRFPEALRLIETGTYPKEKLLSRAVDFSVEHIVPQWLNLIHSLKIKPKA